MMMKVNPDSSTLVLFKQMLIVDEGIELKPYRCTMGKWSIGVGRNLEDTGITEREAFLLLDGDIQRVLFEARNSFPWFDEITSPRQVVVLSMIFNMGLSRFKGFRSMIRALETRKYELAAEEMMKSEWAKQVKSRAYDLSQMMKTGRF